MAKKQATPATPPAPSVEQLVENYLRTEKRSRALFQQQLTALAHIAKLSKPGQTFVTQLGTVQLVDKFAERDVVFKNTAVNRFELKIVAE